ncbi:hypothetical protein SAY86_019797 [Trapa natans]|uniref:Serine/threonine-protein phosphatase 4 regulatory subunit 2 n=1 Tax=Trapa natans TaxID=22666 RepID=A0AAN7R747_TRANT|nr:hypothetical protein SAY86_019797 [Trapa natans]
MSAEINSDQHATDSPNHQFDNSHAVSDLLDNGATVAELKFADDDVRSVIEAIASTGAFWIEWDELKNLLSFKLKQVLSEYPEGTMTIEQQNASLGETYQELVRRLDEALITFDEGPPFTLQRLCEILLSAQSIYPKLSKLALALEKNLLVSSMLTISVDPSKKSTQGGDDGHEETVDNPEQRPYSGQNGGGDTVMSDSDEIMAVGEAEISSQETAGPSEIDATPSSETPSSETAPTHS